MRVLAIAALVAACGDNLPGAPVVLVSGEATLTLSGDRKTLTLARGSSTLLVVRADAVQVGTVDDLDAGDSFDPYWLLVDNPPAAPMGLQWHDAAKFDLVTASESELAVASGPAKLTFVPDIPGCFAATFDSDAANTAYRRFAPDADAVEGFYGLGEWADAVNHRGKLRPMQMELDSTSESSDDENHVPVPLVIGTNGWGLFVKTDRPAAFDVARATDTRIDAIVGTGAATSGIELHLFTADAPLDVLSDYYAVAGVPTLPAPWALGPLLWRDENSDQAQVLDDIMQIRSRHLPTTGIWFDRPYSTGVETFDWSAAKFSDPAAMLQAVHDAGLRYAVWHAPYTAPASNVDPAQAQLDYATAHGFFPPTTAVLLNPWGQPIDFSNPDAYAWWQQQLRAYTDGFGVEGFKLDYAEDVVVGLLGKRTPWAFADGTDQETMHYYYQLLYHRVYREVLADTGAFLLTRTGRWGDQSHGVIIWPGDLDADLSHAGDPIAGQSTLAVGGLPAALTKGISLSASGFPFYASDTGGYRRSPPNRETWVRWVEANSVWPAMEVGDSSSQMPWEYTTANGRDAQALADYQRYTRLHLQLWPYTWTYAQNIAQHPIVRPLGLAFPELGAHPVDEYLLGDAIVVAPVVDAGVTSRPVLLPPGMWRDWWTGAPVTGQLTASADIDTLPLYIAAGGIVPMLRDTIETLSPVADTSIDSFDTDAGILWARISPGADGHFAVYDNTQLDQTTRNVSYAPGSVFTKGALFEVIATPMPASLPALTQYTSRAALLAAGSGWFWEPATGGTLWILVSGAASVSWN
jgi:alpha-D-xyloside xylohydrolase